MTDAQRRLRVVLPLAIFIVVIDTTIMNVSIGAVVSDLDTDIGGVQSAIALYSLVMASFLLTGAKLGDILGRRRAFAGGLVLYGIGSAGTALSVNLMTLIIFWSVVEGLGAALLFPTVQALVRTHFDGTDRVKLYALIGSTVGAGAAVGPVVGGVLTTLLSWRIAFVLEVVVVLVALVQIRHVPTRMAGVARPKFDPVGSILSILGFGSVIVGILSGSRSGQGVLWPLVATGVVLVALLVMWVRLRERLGHTPVFRASLLKIRDFRNGVVLTLVQQFVIGGYLLITPVYVQLVLEYSALQSGLIILPMSLSMFVTSNRVPRLQDRFHSRSLLQFGIGVMLCGIAEVAFVLRPGVDALPLIPGLFSIGVGLGFVISQLNNLILSAVSVDQASEAGGINTTASQFGISLGTALAGTVMLLAFTANFGDLVRDSEVLRAEERAGVAEALVNDARIMSNTDLVELIEENPTRPELREELVRINTEARPDALRLALLAPLIAGLVGLAVSTRLPRDPADEFRPVDA
ncbi:MAG: MFS transporter [Acidimicrobiales bacterium]|nr:MFS transporter [Acidimicrobiales bacterium]